MTTECYRFESVTAPRQGLYDHVADCTFVLIMENTPREAQIRNTVSRYPMTQNTIFQFNRGWRKCDKGPRVKATTDDLVHALNNVFKVALSNGMNSIIVLEDDCEFPGGKIADPAVVRSITEYIQKNDPIVYSFGSPVFVLDVFSYLSRDNAKTPLMSATHCIYYSKRYMEMYIARYDAGLIFSTDGEFMPCKDCHVRVSPVAAQKFPDTENMGNWFNGWPECMRPVMGGGTKAIMRLTGADKDASKMERINITFHALTLAIVCLIVYLVIKNVRK